MNNKLIVSYERSANDVPVLIVATETLGFVYGSSSMNVRNVITGDDAVKAYNLLMNIKEEPDNDREPT